MTAIEIVRVEAERTGRLFDQVRPCAEERKIVDADDDLEAIVDEPQRFFERNAVHSFEMDRVRSGDIDRLANRNLDLVRDASLMTNRLRQIENSRTDERHVAKRAFRVETRRELRL